MVLTLNSENRRLIEELKERDQIMNRVDNKVKIANNSVLHLEQVGCTPG